VDKTTKHTSAVTAAEVRSLKAYRNLDEDKIKEIRLALVNLSVTAYHLFVKLGETGEGE